VIDVLGGHIASVVTPLPEVIQHLKDGKLRMLGMTGAERSPSFPEISTIAEAGVPGYAALFWFGIVAPAATPAPIVDRLSKEIGTILNDPVFKKEFAAQGVDPVSSTPQEFSRIIRDDIPKWTGIMKQAGIEPN